MTTSSTRPWDPLFRALLRFSVARLLPAVGRGMTRARTLLTVALGLFGIAAGPVSAEVIANWGTVITPVSTATSFSFAQTGITKNFTHDYLFSLEGSAGATYNVTFNVGACDRGCGSTSVTYGIYNANGSLVASADAGGRVTLAAGDYSFRVGASGMGSGNSVDYSGGVSFSASASGVVSAAPEPATYLLTLLGLTLVGWAGTRNAASAPRAARAGAATAGSLAAGA